MLDIHTYEDVPRTPPFQANRAIVLGEYGGVGFPVPGHVWKPGKAHWSYQVAKDEKEYLVRFRRTTEGVIDRQARVYGTGVAVRGDLGGRRYNNNTTEDRQTHA